jgi:hypothetical protein
MRNELRAIFLSTLLLLGSLGTSIAASDKSTVNSSVSCPPNYVCLTMEEAAQLRRKQIEADVEIDDLKYELAKLKILVKRPGRVHVTGGIEYIPNLDEHYQPYLIIGTDFGRVSIWGGTFGDEPAVGLGWQF